MQFVCLLSMRRLDQFLAPRLLSALANSVLVSGLTALATVLLGFVLAYAARSGRSRITDIAARLASFGYGVPGTVLAIGVLFPIAALDNAIDAQMRAFFGISTGLLMLERFGSFDLSSFWNTPAAIWRCRK